MADDPPILKEIRQGFRLRPTKTVDKSRPVIVADGEELKKIIIELPPAPPPEMQLPMPPAPLPISAVSSARSFSSAPSAPGPPPPPQMLAPKRVAQPSRPLPKLGGGGGSRDALLASIRGGIRLKKTVTQDKSAPVLSAEVEEHGQVTPGRQPIPNQPSPPSNAPKNSGLMNELQSSAQFGRFQEAADTNVPSFMTHVKDEWASQNEIKREPMTSANNGEERKPNSPPMQNSFNSFVTEPSQEKTKAAYTRQPSADFVRQAAPAQHQRATSSGPVKQNPVNSASTVQSANVLRAIEEQRRVEPPPPPPPPPPSFNPYRINTFQPQLEPPRTERIIETKVIPKPIPRPIQQERIIETKVIPKPKEPEINHTTYKQSSPSLAEVDAKKKQSPSPAQAQSQFVQPKRSFVPQPLPQTTVQQRQPAGQSPQSQSSSDGEKANTPLLPNVNRLRQSFDKAVTQQAPVTRMVGRLPPPKPLSASNSVFVRNGQLRASSPPKAAFTVAKKKTQSPPPSPQKFELSVALEPDVRESRSFEAERLPASPPHRQKSVEFVRRAAPGKLRESIDNPPLSSTSNGHNKATNGNSIAANQPNSAERQWKSVVASRVNDFSSEQQEQQQDKRNVIYDQSEGLLPQVNRLRSAFEANESDSDNSSEISETRYGQTIVLPVSGRQSGTTPVAVTTKTTMTRTVRHVNGGPVPTSTPWVVTKDKVNNNADKHQVSRQVQLVHEKKLEQQKPQERRFGDAPVGPFGPTVGRAHKVVVGSQSHNTVDPAFETMPVEYMRTNFKFGIDLSDGETPIQILQR